MIPLISLFQQYFTEHKAVPAFNIDSFEIYQAVELAVRETGLPCIVQLSAGEDAFIHAERLMMLVKKADADGLPIYLNMDHGQDTARLAVCLAHGFDMVHFDDSLQDYQTNLSATKNFVANVRASLPGAIVEAEFNHINLVNDGVSPESFTKPEQALEFVTATGVNLLAVSIGNLHGVSVKLPEHINVSLLSEIRQSLPQTFFTLHGGSGIPLDQIRLAIGLGVVKININTDLRLAFRASLKNQLAINHSEKIYELLSPAVDDVKNLIIQKLKDFQNA